MSSDQFHLNFSLMSPGHYRAAWRLADADPYAYLDVDHYVRLARIAEEAGIDAVFQGDSPALGPDIATGTSGGLDGFTLLAVIAGATERIGLLPTVSTTYSTPYSLARRFQTLDHLTRGRAALNVVTTGNPAAAANFGASAHPDRDVRYRRAHEFLDVITRLWESWEPDAIVADKATGRFGDRSRIHAVDHHGEFFDVAGPLPVPASPQVRPVVSQAGETPAGLELAAEYADVVFAAGHTVAKARASRDDVRARARAHGRDADSIKYSLGVIVLVGTDQEDAERRHAELDATLPPIEHLVSALLSSLGLPAGAFGPDDVIRSADLPAEPNLGAFSVGTYNNTRAVLAEGPRTLRELVAHTAGIGTHRLVAGSPEHIADDLESWWRQGAADGFTVMFADTRVDLERFATLVVPILKERGLFHREYPQGTLRDRLGLPLPAARSARRPVASTAGK
ncbi:NtaA/DmoA family FMN-dependent monooxygenase [Streptomyces sp. CA2R106]|uniref:NtaA/DmoA family FMN-dependent monooxygenase n=1 Tax=Streptomyces sp. CA2R106 TaxID=3120153 RepID=UPI003009A555